MAITVLEPQKKMIPIRSAYFKSSFWAEWGKLPEWEREVYILGWLAKLDHTLMRLEQKLAKIMEQSNETNRD